MIRFLPFVFLFLPSLVGAESLTATRVIRPDAIIEPQDLSLMPADYPGALGPGDDIIGLETRNTLYPGRPIRAEDVGPVALVKRNQHVTLVFRQGGLMIATEARALQRGAKGEFVRVMNMSSRTTVSGQVAQDGSVIVSGAGQ